MPKLELTKHKGSGQWRKRIGGVDYYFGSFEEIPYKVALSQMRRKQLAIADGHKPAGKLRVSDLVDLWLEAKAQEVSIGHIRDVTFDKYKHVAVFISDEIGSRRVDLVKPSEFRQLQVAAASRWGYHKQRDLVSITRMIFGWGVDEDAINPVRIPKSFRKPLRPSEGSSDDASDDKYTWTPDDIRGARTALLASQASWGEAALLLGINCGLGNTDVSGLEWRHIEEVEGQLVLKKPRAKNGRARMIPLWNMTVSALGPRGEGRILTTRTGLPLVGTARRDALGQTFRRVTGKPFYGLRHMFMTIGSQVGDSEAVRFMMGHAPRDMADHYILSPAWSMSRLMKITEHIETWLRDSPSSR